MSISPRKGSSGRQVHVYDPGTRKKVYAGSVGPCTNPANNPRLCRCKECSRAREIEQRKRAELGTRRSDQWTVRRFAEFWLSECHGPGTTRPEETTAIHNAERISTFVREHGDRLLGSVTVNDVAPLVVDAPHRAKAVRAMYQDAVRRGRVVVSPFAALQIPKGKGRSDITPLTEDEVTRLVEIAAAKRPHWLDFPALLTTAAWAGLRPGELCGLEWPEVDLLNGMVLVQWSRRNDGRRFRTKTKTNRVVPLAKPARDALLTLPQGRAHVFASPTGRPLRPNSLRHYWLPVRDTFTSELSVTHWLSRRLRHDSDDELDPYELRHMFGSMLADRGVSSHDIAEVMGNSARMVEEVYVHAHKDRVHGRVRAALDLNVGKLPGSRLVEGLDA